MKDEEKEEKLIELLAPRRSDAFWAGQKARIMAATAEKAALARVWLLAPAAVAAALLVVLLARDPRQLPVGEPPTVSTAFLEHLDLLDDMDVLEAVPEEELL